jgi:hypothetical protein
MRSRCEVCSRSFDTGRGYSQHIKICLQKLKIPGFRRYIPETSDDLDTYTGSRDEPPLQQAGDGILADDHIQAPLTEDTLRTFGSSPHPEVFPAPVSEETMLTDETGILKTRSTGDYCPVYTDCNLQ